jgi:hypothetical protein
MATLTAQKITDQGVIATIASANAGGDEFLNTGLEFLFVQNSHSGSQTVTVTAQVTNIHHQQFGTVIKQNIVKSVAAGGEAFIGPFKQAAFNDSNHKVQITYSAVTDLNVAVLYLDQQ